MNDKHILIIGGGASGFFAAINCAIFYPTCSITVLEKSNKLLSKVRISGGGRCNVTNSCTDTAHLIKNYPRGEKELQNVFSRFSTSDIVTWFEERGIRLKTEPDGRMFPASNSSETIINCFLQEAEKHDIKIKTGIGISEISQNKDSSFTIKIIGGGEFICDKVIIASGGNVKPSAYDWIQKLGHTIATPVPSLFTFNIPDNNLNQLMGLSVPNIHLQIANTKIKTTGPLLITHWGISGPAVLKASAWGARMLHDVNYHFPVLINWLPEYSEDELLKHLNNHKEINTKKIIRNDCPLEIPKRLWEFLIQKSNINQETRWADLSKKQLITLVSLLCRDVYKVQGKTTFKEEFVTCGGVSLKEIDLKTMQSKIISGLFFAGEVIDVDGLTGGFNFQNAWSTAWIAAKNILS